MSFEPPPEKPPQKQPAPAEPPPPQDNKPGLFHGLEDLPPAEREFYERQMYFRPHTNQVNRYVRVSGDDYLARGFQECIAREIELNPQFAPVLERLERNAGRHVHGLQIKSRQQ